MADPKVCIVCGKDIAGRPIKLRPPDPRYALCKPCGRPDEADTAEEWRSPSGRRSA